MRKGGSFPVHILVFLGPAVLIYTVFMIYPLCDSLWLSLNNKAASGGQTFVGIQNYLTLFSQERWSAPFWNALRNNAVFFVIHMVAQNPIGLLLAALLSTRIRGSAALSYHSFYPNHPRSRYCWVCLETDSGPILGNIAYTILNGWIERLGGLPLVRNGIYYAHYSFADLGLAKYRNPHDAVSSCSNQNPG